MVEDNAILIVEDDSDQRRTLEDVLATWGYSATGVGLGGEALSRLSQGIFCLALLDLKLPDIDGMEVLRNVRSLGHDLDVIMLTAYATVGNAVEAVNLGAFAYVIKPVDLDHLHHLVRRALERRSLKQQLERREQELRANAELQMKVLNERAQHLGELNRRQERIGLLSRAIVMAQRTLDFDQMSHEILRSLLQTTGAQHARLLMLGASGKAEKLVSEFAGIAPFDIHRRPGGMTDTVRTTGRTLYIPDTRSDPRANPDAVRAGMRSCIGLPLKVDDRVEGIIYLHSAEPHAFDAENEFPEAITSTCSICLERARIFSQVEAAKREWESTFDALGEGVVIMDADRKVLRANRAFGRLVGKPVDQIIGKKVCDFVCGPDRLAPGCPMDTTLATGRSHSATLREHRLGGIPLESKVYPIPGMDRRFVHLFRWDNSLVLS